MRLEGRKYLADIQRATRLLSDFEVIGEALSQLAQRDVALEPVLAGDVYGPLRDPALFRRVRIDPEARK